MIPCPPLKVTGHLVISCPPVDRPLDDSLSSSRGERPLDDFFYTLLGVKHTWVIVCTSFEVKRHRVII